MPARLPIDPLPFQDDTTLYDFELPNGDPIKTTKRAFFDIAMGDLYEKANGLAAAKAAESVARARVRDLLYPDGWDTEGTNKFDLGGGWVLEFKRTINVAIDAPALPAIAEAIEKLPVDADSGEMAEMSAITYTPDFSMSKFGLMRDDAKKLLREALTFTPGSPSIKAVPPSAKAQAKATDQKAREA